MSDWTPLHVACWENNLDEVKKQLAENKSNVNAPLNDGLTPLHIAAHAGIFNVPEEFLQCFIQQNQHHQIETSQE